MPRLTANHTQHAFTLLELAIVLVLVGMMAGFAVKLTPAKDCYGETREQLRDVQTALEAYVRANNKYPTPASRKPSVNDPLYGLQTTISTDGSDRIGSGGTAVLVGALPFVTLGLNTNYAVDCWGNKFTYFVSEVLTDSATYMSNTSAGTITIRNGSTALTAPGPSTLSAVAAYAVVSHGKDALGAAKRSGSTTNKFYCNTQQASTTITRVDKENCDTANQELFSATFNDGQGAPNFFDDVIVYANKTGFTGCNAGTVSWSTNCTANVSAMGNADTTTATNTAGGYNGTATVTCTNGTLSLSNTSCAVAGTCAAQSVSWSTNCAGTSTSLASGNSGTVTNTASGYTGTVSVQCQSNGTLTQSSPSCTLSGGGGGGDPAPQCSTTACNGPACSVGTPSGYSVSGVTCSWTCTSGSDSTFCGDSNF